ncbi:MAG: alpha/beta hydrolase [Thermoguttaceae bacterium]
MRTKLGTVGFLILLTWAGWLWSAETPKKKNAPPKVPDGVQTLKDLAYVPGGHKQQRLDLYLPERRGGGPLPIVVYVHGGAWKAGDKAYCPALWLATKGYAVASINYRLSQDAVFPAQIQDCKTAVRWLRAHAKQYGLDPDRVAAWGGSAGGHLVALLATTTGKKEFEGDGDLDQSSRVQAVIDWYGPSDFVVLGAHEKSPTEPLSTLLGGLVSKNEAKARWASPLTYVGKDAPPFLIVQGDQDPVVIPSHSQRLAEALNAAGVEVHLEMLPGAKHGGLAFVTPERLKQIEDFLAKHLSTTGASGR